MKPNFAEMPHKDLLNYILKHREDQEAFHIYLDRAKANPARIHPAPQSIDDLQNFPELQAQQHYRRHGQESDRLE